MDKSKKGILTEMFNKKISLQKLFKIINRFGLSYKTGKLFHKTQR